ncbi:hypothetical protein [Streptomyces sp. NPDC057460]|uniref:hypothetical protein n=1 Tax=Streptomyces sp. NPDC057460 TaxID=3346141 RepID=UPI0036AEB74C
MATTTDGATAAPPAQTDPYALRAEDARPAPETFRGRLRFRANPWLTAALVLSSAAILFLGVYGVLDTLGLTPGS